MENDPRVIVNLTVWDSSDDLFAFTDPVEDPLGDLVGRFARTHGPFTTEQVAERFEAVRLLLPYEEGGKLAELYELGAPIDERIDRPEGVFVRARLGHADLRRFAPFLVVEEDEASQGTRR